MKRGEFYWVKPKPNSVLGSEWMIGRVETRYGSDKIWFFVCGNEVEERSEDFEIGQKIENQSLPAAADSRHPCEEVIQESVKKERSHLAELYADSALLTCDAMAAYGIQRAAEERERCAQTAESIREDLGLGPVVDGGYRQARCEIAAKIRSGK